MEPTEYITENPYRLLGIGSGTLQAELRQRAAADERDFHLGDPRNSQPISQNGDALPLWTEVVYRMDQDTFLRTLYRLFWPFYLPEERTLHDLAGDAEMEWVESSLRDAPGFYTSQIRFLRSWSALLASPAPDAASQTLATYRPLRTDSQATAYLTDLLQQEGVEFARAVETVAAAMARMTDTLLDTLSYMAVKQWSAGAIPEALRFIEVILQSGMPEEALNRAIEPLAVCGRDEEADLLASTTSCLKLLLEGPASTLPGMNLARLATAVQTRLLEAARWRATYDNCVLAMVVEARYAATDLAFAANEPDKAQALLEHLLAQPLPEELLRQVRADLTELRQNIAKGPTNGGLFNPSPQAPSLTTINYIGGRIYGRAPCPERPGWHYVTHYFVFLLIPLIPIRRYLVKDAPGGGWYFFASAPLTRASRYHQTLSFVLLLCLSSYWAWSAIHAKASPPPTIASRISPAQNERIQQFLAEKDRLSAEIQKEDPSLSEREAELKSRGTQLDKDHDRVNRASNRAVDAYNKRVRQLKLDGEQFNKEIALHNKKIDRVDALAKEIRALRHP